MFYQDFYISMKFHLYSDHEATMKHFDIGSMVIITITLILFIIALFFTGFTHDILLETGVFLISVKLIVMTYKSSVSSHKMYKEFQEVKKLLEEIKNTQK